MYPFSGGRIIWEMGHCSTAASSPISAKAIRFCAPQARTSRANNYRGKIAQCTTPVQPEVCGSCALKSRCTTGSRRSVTRHLHDEALQRMQQRTTREVMQLRRSIVEHPFANLKYRIFGHPRFLLRGLQGAQTEISLAVAAYNLKRMRNILGGCKLTAVLQTA